MKPVRLVGEARAEFLEEVRYYENLRPGLGARLREAATAALTRAGEMPLAGKPGTAGPRRLLGQGVSLRGGRYHA
jgi:hypothetical protein